MLLKFRTSSVLVLELCLQVSAAVLVVPALGVPGVPTPGDVKRPDTADLCGAGVNIAFDFDNATAVTVNPAGSFIVNAISFNSGADDVYPNFTASVDPTGTGAYFVPLNITAGRDDSSTGDALEITASLHGTECSGGKFGDRCLVQFISEAGFGNCVVVSQAIAGTIGITDGATVVPVVTTKRGGGTTDQRRGGPTDWRRGGTDWRRGGTDWRR